MKYDAIRPNQMFELTIVISNPINMQTNNCKLNSVSDMHIKYGNLDNTLFILRSF